MKRWPSREPRKTRPVVEGRATLDAMELHRLGAFGERTKSFPFMGVTANRWQLIWRSAAWPADRPSITVAVEWSRCYFGGFRPWFVCKCGSARRVGRLYYGKNFNHIGCRHCLDLRYTSQRKTAAGRAVLRAHKLRIGLADGGETVPGVDPIPPKPPRMHRATFERIAAELDSLERGMRRRGASRLTR